MAIRDKIIKEALDWVNTPFLHQARVKGQGVDCAQLTLGIALNVGLVSRSDVIKVPQYPIQLANLREEILLHTLESFGCEEIKLEKAKPGDILVFKYGRIHSHLGILIEKNRFVHAFAKGSKIVCCAWLTSEYAQRVSKAYKFPGVK